LQPPAITKPDLVHEVTTWVRQRILNGEFATASVLPSEGELARNLGVSRNVVREAMRNLRSQGLVEVSQGKRPRVRHASSEAATTTIEALLRSSDVGFKHLIEARSALEIAIAAAAAQRINSEQLHQLTADVEALSKARSRTRQIEADLAFHRHLVEATANPVYEIMLGSISALLRDLLFTTYKQADLQTSVQSHQHLLAALRQHNAGAASEAMRIHMRNSMRDLHNAIAETTGPPEASASNP